MVCLLLSVNTHSLCLYVLMLLSLSRIAEQIVYYPNCCDCYPYLWCIRCLKHKSVRSVTSNTLSAGARKAIQTTYTSIRAFFSYHRNPTSAPFPSSIDTDWESTCTTSTETLLSASLLPRAAGREEGGVDPGKPLDQVPSSLAHWYQTWPLQPLPHPNLTMGKARAKPALV